MMLRAKLRRKLAPCVLPSLLAGLLLALATDRTGDPHLEAGPAQSPSIWGGWRERLSDLPIGLIHAAAFSWPRLVGIEAPKVVLASLAPAGEVLADALQSLPEFGSEPAARPAHRLERAHKGDLQVPWVQVEISRAALQMPSEAVVEAEGEGTEEIEAAAAYEPFPEFDLSMSFDMVPQVPDGSDEATDAVAADETGAEAADANVALGTSGLYFSAAPLGAALGRVIPWGPGEAPVLALPAVANAAPARDEPRAKDATFAAATADSGLAERGGNAAPQEPNYPRDASPATLLRLTGASRAKAERCLANAVYFEARGEAVRGQVAVAQVVLNRAFSGYYPGDICGVVYQGSNRHLSCQFTFACDGIPDVVTEREPWDRAKRVAKAALDGRVWLEDVGKATHYHAAYVNPYWVRSMRKLQRIGVHTFYRPRRWGNGAEAPSWGAPSGVRGGDVVAKL